MSPNVLRQFCLSSIKFYFDSMIKLLQLLNLYKTMQNVIYILTNEAMPGLVKIGMTTDAVESRITQLSSHTGVPLPFECYFAAEVNDAPKIEKILHQLFSEQRINSRREFFRLDPERVVLALSIGGFKELSVVEPEAEIEEKEALERQKARRPRIKLDALGIKVGDVLNFSRDSTITATVIKDSRVELNGEEMSLSAAALKLLVSMGYKTPTANGSDYWAYDGELLVERRRRMEAAQFEQTSESD